MRTWLIQSNQFSQMSQEARGADWGTMVGSDSGNGFLVGRGCRRRENPGVVRFADPQARSLGRSEGSPPVAFAAGGLTSFGLLVARGTLGSVSSVLFF